jgi:hypothetical protein
MSQSDFSGLCLLVVFGLVPASFPSLICIFSGLIFGLGPTSSTVSCYPYHIKLYSGLQPLSSPRPVIWNLSHSHCPITYSTRPDLPTRPHSSSYDLIPLSALHNFHPRPVIRIAGPSCPRSVILSLSPSSTLVHFSKICPSFPTRCHVIRILSCSHPLRSRLCDVLSSCFPQAFLFFFHKRQPLLELPEDQP